MGFFSFEVGTDVRTPTKLGRPENHLFANLDHEQTPRIPKARIRLTHLRLLCHQAESTSVYCEHLDNWAQQGRLREALCDVVVK